MGEAQCLAGGLQSGYAVNLIGAQYKLGFRIQIHTSMLEIAAFAITRSFSA